MKSLPKRALTILWVLAFFFTLNLHAAEPMLIDDFSWATPPVSISEGEGWAQVLVTPKIGMTVVDLAGEKVLQG